jgi:Cu2+-containing amine oxidase
MEKLSALKHKKLAFVQIGEDESIKARAFLTHTELITIIESILVGLYQIEKTEDGIVSDFKITVTNEAVIDALKIATLAETYLEPSLSVEGMSFIEIAEILSCSEILNHLKSSTKFGEDMAFIDKSIESFEKFYKAETMERFINIATLLSNDFAQLLEKIVEVENIKIEEVQAQIDAMPKTPEEMSERTEEFIRNLQLVKDKIE